MQSSRLRPIVLCGPSGVGKRYKRLDTDIKNFDKETFARISPYFWTFSISYDT